MLAGCSSSSTLLSPRHRVRSEAPSPKNFQARHFPAMNTAQRLDLPCTASFTDDSKPKSTAATTTKASSCSLRQSIRLPPLATTRAISPAIGEDYWNNNSINISINNGVKRKSLKRFADELCCDDRRIKRKKSTDDGEEEEEEEDKGQEEEDQSQELGQFWLNPQVHLPLTYSEEEESFEEQQDSPFPWIEEIVNLGERDNPLPTIGGSSSASSAEITAGNGNRNGIGSDIPNPNPHHHNLRHHQIAAIPIPIAACGSGDSGGGGGGSSEEAEGMEMVSLVSSCLEAMAAKSVQGIGNCIARLGGMASPRAAGTLHRLMAYYTEALALRAARVWPHVFHLSPPRDFVRFSAAIDDDSSPASALRILNQMSPILRFIHFTANEMLLQAFEGKERVHIIDFDIKQGLQWPSLLQSLASRRPKPPSHVRITGVGESKQDLNDAGDRLAAVAATLNLPFEFHAVVDRLEDVRLWMLHVSSKDREAVGVNLALQLHRTLYDSSGSAIRDFLGLVRSVNPTVVVVAEQESDGGDDSGDLDLESRVSNSLRYYSAIFDAVASGGASPESAARARVEEIFGKEIRNIVACEGFERAERHVGFATWQRIMEDQGGFRHVRFPTSDQARMLLRMYGWSGEGQNGYLVTESFGGVTLGWRDQPLFTVSAWTS